MHSPAARALLQPCALLHHSLDTLKDLIVAGHVITITYWRTVAKFNSHSFCECFMHSMSSSEVSWQVKNVEK